MNREQVINFIDRFYSPYARISGHSSGVRILMYHLVSCEPNTTERIQNTVSVDCFRGQLEVIRKSGWKVITLREAIAVLAKGVIGKHLVITFDDFYLDTVENTVPILLEYNFPASFFVITDYLDSNKHFEWLEKPEHYPISGTRQMVREVAAQGFEVGSHTRTHPRLQQLNPEQVRDELSGSKQMLEDLLGVTIDLFSYPFGAPSAAPEWVQKILRESGYVAGLSNFSGLNHDLQTPFYLRRTHVSQYDRGQGFLGKLNGVRDWYTIWQRLRDK